MSIFQRGTFKLHSGAESNWRIDLDDLTESEIRVLARLLAEMAGPFTMLYAVPSSEGSAVPRLARALEQYRVAPSYAGAAVLILDDVLTSGGSMTTAREKVITLKHQGVYADRPIVGAVVFARGECPPWVRPLFKLHGSLTEASRVPVTSEFSVEHISEAIAEEQSEEEVPA